MRGRHLAPPGLLQLAYFPLLGARDCHAVAGDYTPASPVFNTKVRRRRIQRPGGALWLSASGVIRRGKWGFCPAESGGLRRSEKDNAKTQSTERLAEEQPEK